MISDSKDIQYSPEREAGLNQIDRKYFEGTPSASQNYFNVHRPTDLIISLQERVSKFPKDLVPTIVNDSLKDEVITTEVSQSLGTGHIIVFVDTKKTGKVVIRANSDLVEPEYYMELEHIFLDRFRKLGIPVNDLLYSDISRSKYPFDFQIMRPLPGLNLGSEFNGTQSDYETIAYEQGQYYAKLYQGEKKGSWGRLLPNNTELKGFYSSHNDFLTASLEHDLEVITLFGLFDRELADRIMYYFKSGNIVNLFADTHPHLIHNDPSDLNMRYEGNRFVGYFDWENAVLFDPINEIATAPTWKSAHPKEDSLVKGFREGLGYNPANFDAKQAVYYLRKAIDKAAFALKGKRLSQRHIDMLRTGLELNHLLVP